MSQADAIVSSEAVALRRIRTPRAAAVAGIVFALLLITSEVLVWTYVRSVSTIAPTQVARHARAFALAMNLRPFAGIAFLWFMGVVRHHLGDLEDRFFSTIFMGSGLLYVAMMFISGALAGAAITVFGRGSADIVASGAYDLVREELYKVSTIYGTRMAAVFMTSTSTIFMQTGRVPRWMALLGYVLAAILLLSTGEMNWLGLVFPVWVMVISAHVLIKSLELSRQTTE